LAPGLPISIGGQYPPAVASPALGGDTVGVLSDWLGMSAEEVDGLVASGTVATGRSE
ncbi:2-methylfumaryl-CoA isomerase, partial [Mycobacteroides abscessus subsp. massiliense]|nr:2-methylfumaryl-CoA isomerase [Mycobacteroides abscessus subsp. massiliense]